MADGIMEYMPYMSGGLSAIGQIWSLIQQIQRNRQLEELRRYYTDPNQVTSRAQQYWNWMLPAAQSQVSRLAGDAATRGWSGYPRGLAEVTAQAYAPFQQAALQYALGLGGNIQPFLTSPAQGVDPFGAFLRSMTAVRDLQRPQTPFPAPTSSAPPDMSMALQELSNYRASPSTLMAGWGSEAM